jgi:hypothetical protein
LVANPEAIHMSEKSATHRSDLLTATSAMLGIACKCLSGTDVALASRFQSPHPLGEQTLRHRLVLTVIVIGSHLQRDEKEKLSGHRAALVLSESRITVSP